MFDMHFDLLTVAYKAYLEQDFTFLEEWCKNYNDDNVRGLIANLYFMSKEEMSAEIHPKYYQDEVSIIEMFKIAKQIVETYLPNTKIIWSIEGCDYLDINDLEELYNEGLRNILPVWNEKNKYASGNRSDDGLTEEGKRLLDKLMELGISIDISHANEKSFYDIIEYVKQQDQLPLVIASHSNARTLCDRRRNLTDKQLYALKDIDGLVGIFSNRNFIVKPERKDIATKKEQRKEYLNHIKHVVDIMGIDNVVLATDDMTFASTADPEYKEVPIYNYSTLAHNLTDDLRKYYTAEESKKLLYKTAEDRYYNRLI